MLSWIGGLPTTLSRVTNSTTYVPQIDGLRFLAILPVLIYHAGARGERFYQHLSGAEIVVAQYLPHGSLGVSLFFFVSGYIIAYPFLSGRAPSLKHFFLRRLTRLEPPYVVVMLGCFAILSIVPAPMEAPNFYFTQAPLWQSLLASLTYSHSLVFGEHPRLNPPTWSLEREVQFYVLAPLILYVYGKIRVRGLRVGVGVALTVVLLVLGAVISDRLDRTGFVRNTLLAESYGFMLGIVACDYVVWKNSFSMPPKAIFDIGFVIGLIGILFTGAVQFNVPFHFEMANSFLRATCILLLFMAAARGTWSKAFLGLPWIALIGGACYSIYLVHLPVIQAGAQVLSKFVVFRSLAEAWVVSWAVLVPVTLMVGMLFYALVERPCMDPRWPEKAWHRVVQIFAGPWFNRSAPET
ncbi:acyltransferase family protein [Bradyrhizobium erythrophlei]|uniref:acyltransferase family protein n=1 Tax=Bradyrhizobium erythrophlei TaxID=1437360 RepID=UPI0035EB18BE